MGRRIPQGWQELEFQDFLKFTPREVDKPKGQYRSLGIRSHCKGTFIREVENPDKVMMETLYAVKKNDLIVNITFAWEGAVALVKESDEGALVSHRFPTYVFDRNAVIPEFFQYLIPSKRFVYNLGIISPGGAGRNRVLDRKDFLHLQFITPPVEEQKKIAKILSTWDRAIETLDKLIKEKTHRFEWLLNYLTTPHKKAKDWKDISLGEIGDICKGKGITKDDLIKNGVPCIRYADLYTRYDFVIKDIFSFVSLKTASSAQPLQKGNIVFAGSGETAEEIGKCAVYLGSYRLAVVGGDTLVLRQNRFDSNYLSYALNSKAANKQKSIYGHGHSVVHLYRDDLSKVRIFIPSADQQRKTAQILNCIKDEIGLIEQLKQYYTDQKQGLMQKLLTGKIRVSSAKGKDGAK